MKDVLSEIIAHKKVEVDKQKQLLSIKDIEKRIEAQVYTTLSLKESLLQSPHGIIAEFKRRSPSKLWINREADASAIPLQYEQNGAAALSILTDEVYFGGTIADLQQTISLTNIPVLRKEFIVDEYQIYESKMLGAHAILLIASALTPQQCNDFTKTATNFGLDVLLELHDVSEIDHISPLNNMIGVNNRNLGSFVTDVEKSYQMIEHLPTETVLISESGISDAKTVHQLRQAGYRGFLIGENFMKAEDPGDSLKQFINNIV